VLGGLTNEKGSGKTIVSRTVGNLLIVAHSDATMTEAEANEIFAALKDPKVKTVLVHAGGKVVLDARQRSELAKTVKEHDLQVVVLTDSAVQRGIVTALGWVTGRHSSFAPTDLEGAFDHLRLTKEARAAASAELASMIAGFTRLGRAW
jgi:hypothetical protein